jgi:phosphate/sulfate permease
MYSGGRNSVQWKMVLPILGAWVFTVPLAGMCAAVLAVLFRLGL